jgi:hypothetical protein
LNGSGKLRRGEELRGMIWNDLERIGSFREESLKLNLEEEFKNGNNSKDYTG